MIGLLFIFDDEKIFLKARDAFASDRRFKDWFAPFPVGDENSDMDLIHRAAGFGALGGLLTAFVMQAYSTVISAPLDVGGRPLFSWPAYIPVCFVLSLLGAGLAMTFSLFIKLKMPWYNHPVFASGDFDISRDQFYLQFEVANTIEAEELEARLHALGSRAMRELACD